MLSSFLDETSSSGKRRRSWVSPKRDSTRRRIGELGSAKFELLRMRSEATCRERLERTVHFRHAKPDRTVPYRDVPV